MVENVTYDLLTDDNGMLYTVDYLRYRYIQIFYKIIYKILVQTVKLFNALYKYKNHSTVTC